MKKIAVIGAGSAGILSLCHFIYYFEEYQIVSIHDPNIPFIGIGESTNPLFIDSMQNALHIGDFGEFIKSKNLDATLKHGTLFKNWRDIEFLNPLFGQGLGGWEAIHFNTHKLKDFAFERLSLFWGDRFKKIQGTVTELKNGEDTCTVTVDNQNYDFDYVVDCRGYPKDSTGYMSFDMPLNHGLIHNVPIGDDWGYTLHQATPNGWLFAVPLTSRVSYGYLFNSDITDIDEARQNFSSIINVPVNELDSLEYKFKAYCTEKIIDGRIIKNGNAAFFFEPMIANSLWLGNFINRAAADHIKLGVTQDITNQKFRNKALEIHDLICYYYHGGSNYDTDFWKYAVEYSTTRLETSPSFKEIKNRFKYMRENNCVIETISPYSTESLFRIDKFLGYNYF